MPMRDLLQVIESESHPHTAQLADKKSGQENGQVSRTGKKESSGAVEQGLETTQKPIHAPMESPHPFPLVSHPGNKGNRIRLE